MTLVRPHKPVKIDLNQDYPCPCRRKGHLLPIVLTEAFGCDRCQQIFVVEDNGQNIEQLSSSYPYKRIWRWTGYRWLIIRPGLSSLGPSIIIGIALAGLFMVLPAIIFWLAYRR
ncbi:hypothetical protein WH8501_13590 [Crocosphaera watsonii WH 8501]|uniref:hypothetical protein n=1 Tax=Crocosphaera watsonii TaxID=263511 RepID=UPI003D303878